MSAPSDFPRARAARGPLLGLVVLGSLAIHLSASASLNADLSVQAPTAQLASDSESEGDAKQPAAAGASKSAEEGAKLRSSDARPGSDGKETGAIKPGPRAEARAGAGLYQIRCWQEGRLVFEETLRSIDHAPGQYSTKLQGKDRSGAPVFIADTRNATCLVKGVEGTSDRVPAWLR